MNKIIMFIMLMFIPVVSFADLHYVTKAGKDSGTCTQGSPCLTITYGISQMAGGDTLIVGNGTYTDPIRYIPSGSAGAYTTVRAESTGGVLIDRSGFTESWVSPPINLYDESYVVIDGFKLQAYSGQQDINGVVYISGPAHHIKLFRIAAHGAPRIGNCHVFVINGASNILLEECWAWGTGRYLFEAQSSTNVIFRRCVSRRDHHEGTWNKQTATFTNYDSTNTQFQNCIAIDSGIEGDRTVGGDSEHGIIYGGFWEENNNNTDKSGKIVGSIVLNVKNMWGSVSDWKATGTREISNNVFWDVEAGYVTDDQVSPSIAANITLNRNTIGVLNKSSVQGFTYGAEGRGSLNAGTNNITAITKNSIIYDAEVYGIGEYMVSDYNVLYGNTANYGGDEHTPSAGAHDITTTNPRTNGLLYLPRIETGSTLKTAGEGGGQIGAQIMYQHGVSGTLYGETGYDTLTATPLWPFPNEALIKADMATFNDNGINGARGFAATGKQLNGVDDITLTSYIWEYLGNKMPSTIYKRPIPPRTLRVN